MWAKRREAEKAQIEAELAAEPEIIAGVETREILERENLQSMKTLVRKITRLEKLIAQENSRS